METRYFQIDEQEKLLQSIHCLWKPNHIYTRNLDVLNHLFLKTPYRANFVGERNYSFLGIWNEDSIVGLMGIIPQEMNLAGKRLKSMTSSIWCADRTNDFDINGYDLYDYIFSHHCDLGMWITLGLTPIAYTIDQRLGWNMIDDLPRWITVIRPKDISEIFQISHDIEPLLPHWHSVTTNMVYHVQVDSLDLEKWDIFYERKFASVTMGTCRDSRFLNWRYNESPVLRYHLLTVEDNAGHYCGMAVFRIENIMEGKYRIGRILEFISVDSNASVVLANSLIDFDTNVLMWDFYCLSDITAFGLECVGFQKIPIWANRIMIPTRFHPVDYEHLHLNGAIYLPKDIKKMIGRLGNRYQWYVTRGDSDQDRAN